MGAKGINIRQVGDRLLFRAVLIDSAGDKVIDGTTLLYLYEIQSDGTLKAYDWNSHTFKTTTLTTETQNLTHRTTNNNSRDTGIWSYALTTVSGFTPGNIYITEIMNSNLGTSLFREFQYGADESDLPMVYGRVDDSALAATSSIFETDLSVTADSHFNKGFLLFITGVLGGQVGKVILDFEGTATNVNGKGKITLSEPFTVAPSDQDLFLIVGAAA